jgi:ubiquinone/menaquinone biosynthesis C-methylase UbiE
MLKKDERFYYSLSKKASEENGNHPGFVFLKKIAEKSKKILDVGCGEGTHLASFVPHKNQGVGIDVNQYAITLAKKQFPQYQFINFNGQKISTQNNYFDLVYSTFVLEHTLFPEKIINEMIRVLKLNGTLVLICPNFGSPNRRSPNSTEKPIKKLFQGFIKDFIILFKKQESLNWTKVHPKKKYLNIDDDTTVEPYLHTLVKYLQSQKIKIIKRSSLWELEETKNPFKKIIAFLGHINIFPFSYYGPQIFVVGKKTV